jgi:aconitate hydratase
MADGSNPFKARGTFESGTGPIGIYRLGVLEDQGLTTISKLPYSIRVLLESVLRKCDGHAVTCEDVEDLAKWNAADPAKVEIPFMPARVVLQDFTGVPCVVDLAAMRAAMSRLGGDAKKINPLIPVDLVIDHSVQVDRFGTSDSLAANVDLEFQRNRERYEFLRWGQKAFANFRVVPPNVGIVHQVNLEFLAKVVFRRNDALGPVAIPDTLVGTDSHTTMINGLGVLGWGVGGIEAEAAMLGQPIYMLLPQVIGVEITGRLKPGTTATDLVLTVTEAIRKKGVVDKFVEFYGPGVSNMTLADRATIANMAPEYGATMGYFPIDDETLRYLSRTGRTDAEVMLVERYAKENLLFRSDTSTIPTFTDTLKLDLGSVEPSLAGPKRPQDRVRLADMKSSFNKALTTPLIERGYALKPEELTRTGIVENGKSTSIGHGAVVIAAITSCTNTSNPSVMIAAGLLAKKAVARGLNVKPYVKTSLAPGSRVVTAYLDRAGLTKPLEQLGFHTVGYGCTTCIGNSGPLPENVIQAVMSADLVVASVLSGNRNFEGRVNPHARANYLASPPLVVAYALAGTTDIDLTNEPLGIDPTGSPVYLQDIWPTQQEIDDVMKQSITAGMFSSQYQHAFTANEQWNAIETATGDLYKWDPDSTYIQEPPFLADFSRSLTAVGEIRDARCLAILGDSVTTDHISPAGSIAKDSPAGKFLRGSDVQLADFNSYGARRGNDRVMVRGTFANIRIRNAMLPGVEGGYTRHLPSGELLTIYDAAMKYRDDRVPLVILAGSEYGTGSSRDWAAKGPMLLGVRAVIATSYERIHRSNLVGMGILPLQFLDGQTWQSMTLDGTETYHIPVNSLMQPRSILEVTATKPNGKKISFTTHVRIDTPVEMEYFQNGGILQTVLRNLF